MAAAGAPARATPRFARLVRSLPDARLVARIRAGDEQAFAALYDRYHRPLLAFCRHMLGTREEAEDALQHVFVSAHRHLSAGDRVIDVKPWLYAVARNRCLSVLRARRDAVALDDVPEPSTGGLALASEVEQRQDLKDVLDDIARLPDDQREALVLSELGALSHDEIAALLGVRREKVKALVFQAREALAGRRRARDTDCRVIREQLATLRGGALRRGPLRRHLDTCDGCRTFRSEVRRQREALAVLLPVAPGLALKSHILGAAAAGGASAGGVVTGVTAGVAGVTAGSSAAGGAAAGGALTALAGKALIVAAVAGTAGGGYAVVTERDAPAVKAPRAAPPALAAPAADPRPASATAEPTPTPPAAGDASGRPAAPGERRAERAGRAGLAKGRPAVPGGRRRDGTGRPATPGERGLERPLKAQGLGRRATPAPGARRRAPGDRGASSTAPGRATPRPASPSQTRRPGAAAPREKAPPSAARPTRPVTPAEGAAGGADTGASGKAGKATDAVPAAEAMLPARDPVAE